MWREIMFKVGNKIFNPDEEGYSTDIVAQAVYDISFYVPPNRKLNERQFILRQEATLSFLEVDGLQIQHYEWNPSGTKRALLVHGFGGRCLDFEALINLLVKQNFKVIGFDASGHGFSEGAFPDIGAFWRCLDKISKKDGAQFDLCISHSFGSSALTYQMRKDVIKTRKMIMFAPNAIYDAVILGFLNILNVPKDIYAPLCELVIRRFATRLNREDLWSACSVIENLRHCMVTGLIFHGTQDKMFPLTDSQRIVEQYQYPSLKLYSFECGHREVLFDQAMLEIFNKFCLKIDSLVSPVYSPEKGGFFYSPSSPKPDIDVIQPLSSRQMKANM
jgi:pimeloyl-ACP methyl ester carboxylesterase